MVISPHARDMYANSRKFAQFINGSANVRANLLAIGLSYDDYEKLLNDDILDYICELSVVDGEVTEAEIQFIKGLLSVSVSVDDVEKRARKLLSNEHAVHRGAPDFIRCLCMTDRMNAGSNNDITAAEITVGFFSQLGYELVVADSDMQEAELNWVLARKDAMLADVKKELSYLYTGCAEKTGIIENYRKNGSPSTESDVLRADGGTFSDKKLTLKDLLSTSAALTAKESNAEANENIQQDALSVEHGSEAANMKTVEELLAELDSLIGLQTVKSDVRSLINLMKIRKIRDKRGIPQPPMSLHMVFSGNPGTGKTTIARLLSEIYRSIGLLSKGHLVETDRSGLVGGFVGQTAIKTKEVIDKSQGGILFIDEAYALTSNKSEGDYGQEAVDTLLKAMEDNRDDFIVIVAGYPDLMQGFLGSNPGMASRFNKFIHFADYSAEQLMEIFLLLCKKNSLELSDEADSCLRSCFIEMESDKPANFANGREVRNMFERILAHQANRLALMDTIDDASLSRIEYEDVAGI